MRLCEFPKNSRLPSDQRERVYNSRIIRVKCPDSGSIMELQKIAFPIGVPVSSMHKEIANGYFPLL
jgi:hypothetical protein